MLMFWVDEHMNRQCLTALQQDPCIAVLDFGTQGNKCKIVKRKTVRRSM